MLQVICNGITTGLLYAVLGVAFSLVYSTTRVLFLALGAIFAFSPYVTLFLAESGLPWILAASAAILSGALIGVVCENFIHWPLSLKRAPSEVHFIASLGAFISLVQVTAMIWGSDTQVFSTGIDRVFDIGSVRFTHGQLFGGSSALLCLLLLSIFLAKSGAGLRFKALACNARLLSVLGQNVRCIRLGVFAVAGAMASVVSVCTAADIGFDPHSGMRAVLIGLTAAVVGGQGQFAGAAIAGFALGVLRALVIWYTSAQWEDAVTFAALAACLILLPGGLNSLLVRRRRLEETL